jgi:hypothetical protein
MRSHPLGELTARVGGRPVLRAASLCVLLWLAVAGAALRGVGLSGDSVTTWATAAPNRSVLCVSDTDPPRLTLAIAPTGDDREAATAELLSAEDQARWGPFTVHLRHHAYRGTVEVAGVEIPWMKNDYTAGWPDLPAHLAWRVARAPWAGQWVHLLLGALALWLASLVAGRLGGWPAALVCGAWLATDVWFLTYKRMLGGHEVMLQVLAMAGLALLTLAALEGRARAGALAAVVLGLGVHVKPSFAAVVAALLLASPVVWWGARRALVVRAAAVGAALMALGFAPTLLFQQVEGSIGHPMVAGLESASGRIGVLMAGMDRARDDLKARTGALDAALRPAAYWTAHWKAVGASVDRTAPPGEASGAGLGASDALAGLLVLIGGLGAVGLVRDADDAPPGSAHRVAEAVVLVALALPFALRLLSPDPHHLAPWLPFFAVALGLGVARGVRGRRAWAAGAGLLVGLVLVGRVHGLAAVEQGLRRDAGRFSVAEEQRKVADALVAEGALDPAVLDYNAMSVLTAWSGGEVRPFLYARASLGFGEGCLRGDSPRFLEQILRSHRGGHLLVLAGPAEGPGGMPDPYRSSNDVLDAGRATGLRLREAAVLDDAQGRWLATIWSIGR